VTRTCTPWPRSLDGLLVELCQAGQSTTAIAKVVGRPRTTVQDALRRLGLNAAEHHLRAPVSRSAYERPIPRQLISDAAIAALFARFGRYDQRPLPPARTATGGEL
jgi:hypothetical protein